MCGQQHESIPTTIINHTSSMNEPESPNMKLYFNQITRIPLLTAAEEYQLAKRVRAGDSTARERMINANLRFVVRIANGYVGCGLSIEDLIAEGNIGLMKAVDRFNPDGGCKLTTYAVYWIRQSIRRALARQSKTIRLSEHTLEKAFTAGVSPRIWEASWFSPPTGCGPRRWCSASRRSPWPTRHWTHRDATGDLRHLTPSLP